MSDLKRKEKQWDKGIKDSREKRTKVKESDGSLISPFKVDLGYMLHGPYIFNEFYFRDLITSKQRVEDFKKEF